jgi:hypothetical protein
MPSARGLIWRKANVAGDAQPLESTMTDPGGNPVRTFRYELVGKLRRQRAWYVLVEAREQRPGYWRQDRVAQAKVGQEHSLFLRGPALKQRRTRVTKNAR